MLPVPIFEWAVWATLDSYKNTELILLKGHLLLEIALSQTLERHSSLSEKKISDMSFHKKLLVLQKVSSEKSLELEQALTYAKTLNSLRNKLAHESSFNYEKEEVSSWAEGVLGDFPCTKFQKFTPRTKLTQAIASLSTAVYAESAA